ncbi:chloride channel CLIC-like protein 1 isoform X2 [Protopterus annectens]|uniref:chloride channel CLIC-like protein 1 isoform X2 n=1 Tax=Protopterus annectens TaxID=7888 RepID=UPI001CFB8449|nr:chloride channel CLIC-like protein 1 isoform X2 [Protopterus annectens]
MEKFGLPSEANQFVHYDAEVLLSKDSLSELEKFLKGDPWKSGLLDEALSSVLVDFKLHDPEAWRWKFEDTFGIELHTLLMVLGCLVLLSLMVATELWTCVSWFVQLKRILFISVIVSLVWNWLYLYKIEFANHHAKVVQIDKKVDDICIGLKKMDWKDSLFEWWRASFSFVDDPCKVYYETLLVNPVLLVPPTRAVSLTFTTFVTEPFKHVGQAFGEFYKALLKDLPVQHQIPVIVMVLIGVLAFFYGFGSACTRVGSVRQLLNNNQPPPPLSYVDRNLPLPEPDYRGGGDADDCAKGRLRIRNNNKNRNEHSSRNTSCYDHYDYSGGAGISEQPENRKNYPDCRYPSQPPGTNVPEVIPSVDVLSNSGNAEEESHSLDIIRKMSDWKSNSASKQNVQVPADEEEDFKDVKAPRRTREPALDVHFEDDLCTAPDEHGSQPESSGKMKAIGMEGVDPDLHKEYRQPVPESSSSCAPSFEVLAVEE